MTHAAPIDLDSKSAPFEHFSGIHRLAPARRGHAGEHARHQLYVARDRRSRTNVLIKVTSKPGVVYERDLQNEIASLTTINRELPDSRYFPILGEHGRLRDGRFYLTMSCFDEWPLATMISAERIPARQSTHLRVTFEVAKALDQLHRLKIWHVDLNPLNILCRWEGGNPVIRVVDFESSYEVARHSAGEFYSPPTTSGYSAPEVSRRGPDARSDLFSLGAVLYTMLAGYDWTWTGNVARWIDTDAVLAPELKEILLTTVDDDPRRRYASIGELRQALMAYAGRAWPGRAW
jgi:serine/threonine protein kinase